MLKGFSITSNYFSWYSSPNPYFWFIFLSLWCPLIKYIKSGYFIFNANNSNITSMNINLYHKNHLKKYIV